MNPLIGIAMGLAPDIIKLIAGDKTGQLADQVGKAVADAVGTTNAGEAQTKLAANPAAEAALRQKLAELAIDATKDQNADASQRAQDALADTQGARSGLQALATTNSTIAWTAPTISYLVIGGFFAFLFVLVWLYWGKPVDNQNNFIVQIINIAVGALTAAFATVVNFWLGSSAGSRKKDDANLSLQQAQDQTASANMKSLQDKIVSSLSLRRRLRRRLSRLRPRKRLCLQSHPITRLVEIRRLHALHLQGGGRLFGQSRGPRRPDQFRHHAGDLESL